MLAIDTLKLAEELKKGGFNEEQTATLVDLGRDLSNQALEKVATREDLGDLEERIGSRLEAMEERMDLKFDGLRKDVMAEMKLLEQRMIIKLGAMIAVAVGLMVMFERLFPPTLVIPATG